MSNKSWQSRSSWELYIIANKIKPINTNEETKLEEADKQSLYFTARQDPYNSKYLHVWYQYAFVDQKYCWKRNSDAPSLMKAVYHDQKMVVDNRIRNTAQKYELNVPNAINGVVFKFYVQKAIYPVPQLRGNKYYVPYKAGNKSLPNPSWRINAEESLANYNHPLNEQTRENYKKARDSVTNNHKGEEIYYEKSGQYLKRGKWHKWHVSH